MIDITDKVIAAATAWKNGKDIKMTRKKDRSVAICKNEHKSFEQPSWNFTDYEYEEYIEPPKPVEMWAVIGEFGAILNAGYTYRRDAENASVLYNKSRVIKLVETKE